MQVTTHSDATFMLYSAGNPDGTISLFRRMSSLEAEYAFPHQSLQGGAMKWISESFIKCASFSNLGVNAVKDRTDKILEYRILVADWILLRGAAIPQAGAAGAGLVQYHHEGIYRADTTQGGPFRNYGIPNGMVAWFNTLIQSVQFPQRIDYRTQAV